MTIKQFIAKYGVGTASIRIDLAVREVRIAGYPERAEKLTELSNDLWTMLKDELERLEHEQEERRK